MHLCVFHHASWRALRHVKQASFITCSAYESEKVHVDKVLEEVHPPVVLDLSVKSNLLCNAGKPRSIQPFASIYKSLLHFSSCEIVLSN
jgi:hypothetical protein